MSRPPHLTLPPRARAYALRTERGAFAVHDAAPDGPPAGTALLVPGFTASKEDFITLLAPLSAAGFRVVAVDGRGQYESEGPPDEAAYTPAELARDVLAQAAAVGAGHPVHLLGHSLGGLIARAAVLRDPTPFASLTLMSSGPAAVDDSQQARLKLLTEALASWSMQEVWEAMRQLDPPEAAGGATPAAVQEFLYHRWMGTRPEQLVSAARQLMTAEDRVAELAEVALPTHVLSGVVDYAWPVPQMDDMAARLKARRTVIAGAEHSPAVDRPAETAQALLAFWRTTNA
ncbi:alpha/beta fold hydrolase [Streptomyces zagrosensis]|uniref:Pimeloyl-ACP methyl ester carboxylesterase n=1 Tax=Streptomyces zagrosensis TaxID=1042984 RepID=A0A7W9QAY4_9ACTN|nr:alpha/beta hydrolase [Streptomyces zagrosensis]MBB5936786.1 pimeloyl-ACP methyl ester carboxylesterase [Streptomyces zagrosensis]